MNVEVNYLAVLLAGVASMAVGFLWYSPFLFAKQWMKEKGYTKEYMEKAGKDMGKWYGMSFVVSLIQAYVLAHVMFLSNTFFQHPMLTAGLSTAFWMWLGFVMPTQFTATIFGGKNFKLFGIDTGYQLASLLVMGVVLGLMA